MPMEAKEIFEAESQSVRKLLSEPGVGFYVPPYQRPYSWAKDKVERLLEDTLHGFRKLIDNDESFTFLGSIITIHDRDNVTIQPIVRTDVPARVLNVIDGQQRLTTLLLTCVALHNLMRLMHAKLLKPFKGVVPPHPDPVNWLDGQTLTVTAAVQDTFLQLQPHGTARKYPRMIRAFDDQWSRNKDFAKYTSPVAYLISNYCEIVDLEKPVEFKPAVRDGLRIEGEDALVGRYGQIVKTLKSVYSGRIEEELEEFPTIDQMLKHPNFQKALLNHEFPSDVEKCLADGTATDEFKGLLRLVLFASYILDRIAVTVVKGKNEDYAFSVFESLNTTGEPLTAFETFRPRVVSAEGLGKYESCPARQFIDQVADYLAGFKAGDPLQTATRDLLVTFASAETGEKLSKRLADQRRYLKEEYERYEKDPVERLAYVRHLRDTALFTQFAWASKDEHPVLQELPIAATTDTVKLCLAFLNKVGHTMTVGPLVRFYAAALSASAADQSTKVAEFEAAIKAITAFSVLWRGSRRGTANIDHEYRELMTGNNAVAGMAPLARKLKSRSTGLPDPAVDAVTLKAELRARFVSSDHGDIANRDEWVNRSMQIPAYSNNGPVTRFILLSAYHDAVEDPAESGLIAVGKAGVSQCLTFDGWCDENHLSLEHIAPKDPVSTWDASWYEDREVVHRIGNLVLVQKGANSSLSNRPWKEKTILYAALGAKSQHDATKILDKAKTDGITFAQSTNDLVEMSAHMPHLAALGSYGVVSGGDWTTSMAEKRSRRLLELAWDRLWAWLN